MKNCIRFTTLVITGFVLLFLFNVNTVYGALPSPGLFFKKNVPGSVKISTKEIKSSSEIINVDLKIPVLTGMKDKELQKNINERFFSEEMGFRDQIEKSAVEFQKYAEEHNIPKRPFEANVSYKVTYNKNNLLSITFYYYMFTGGAHGGTKVISYNIDLKGGKTLALKDFFLPNTNYKAKINSEILRQIKENKGFYFENAFKSIKDTSPFYITPDNMVFYFQEYEIAPYVAGTPEFSVPISTFKNQLNPELNLQ